MSSGTRILVGFTFGVAVVVGGVVSLGTCSWWFLILAIALHATGTAVVLGTIGRRLREQEKPDPITEARIVEEGDEDDRPHMAA